MNYSGIVTIRFDVLLLGALTRALHPTISEILLFIDIVHFS
jgi:hypothetical protein